MADETENQNDDEQTPDAPQDAAPDAPQDAESQAEPEAADEPQAADETPAEPEPEPADEAPAEPVDEAPAADAADEPAAEAADEPAADAGGEDASGAAGEAPQSDEGPAEKLSPKQLRRNRRSRHTGEVRPSRTPEERHAERLEARAKKAVMRRARRKAERAKAAERRAAAPPPEPLAPVHAPVEGKRRVRQGVVVSDKAEKTITVRIEIARRHRRYEKIVRSSSTVHAHDENNDAHEGDVVRVIESRPLSRTKRWALVDVVERAR